MLGIQFPSTYRRVSVPKVLINTAQQFTNKQTCRRKYLFMWSLRDKYMLINFNVSNPTLIRKFDARARELRLTRTQLLFVLMEVAVKLPEEPELARVLLTMLEGATKVTLQEAKNNALIYAEAYKRAKEER